ncbi:MAG: hypothetical protein H0W50_04065, partial [Parachlamydiaceae bacterium]|nr:hypothetical protein [Parachlamydiaceae bacterium]
MCVKILRSTSNQEIKQKAFNLYVNLCKKIPLLFKGNEVVTDEDLERFGLFDKFYKTFPQNPVIAVKTPEECRELIARKEPLKGIYVLQFSYADQFDLNNPVSIAKINPSLVIVDEAHELISMTESLLHSQNFFKFTTLVSSLLIHPDLIYIRDNKIYKTEIDALGKKISKMPNSELVNYIKQSGLLSKLFLDKESKKGKMTIREAMDKSERALMFVSEMDHAEFIKVIAKKHFKLMDNQISVIHSQNKKSESEIAEFKKLKEKGIQILLPKSGGAGINYTEVVLNILAAVGWT